MDKFLRLRNENPLFIYRNYHITENLNSVDISYDFEIPGLAEFHPSWSFSKPADFSISNDFIFEKLVFSLGMVEAVSYWKAVCAPQMRVDCGELSEEQISWWKKLYFMGLGEFFYVNNINTDIESFVNINPTGSFTCKNTPERAELHGCLVPIGGGKDSALTIETLHQAGLYCKCYSINNRCSIRDTVKVSGLEEDAMITVKRVFDRSLINLNNAGYLNGHTPFSAIVAFSAEITAYIHRLKYIVLSNECSANESTVTGQEINHQYSKSFEFENDFHMYENKYLGTGIYYFSFLRPLTEFQIAKMFVSHKKYLPIFRSCNLGSKVSPDIWCADCPKCLFVTLILSPFINSQELIDIFGKNLLNEPEMLSDFEQLIGKGKHKPFECVGSVDEVNLAVTLAIRNYEDRNNELPLLFKHYKNCGYYLPQILDTKLVDYCNSYDNNNLLPDEFAKILKNEMERLL